MFLSYLSEIAVQCVAPEEGTNTENVSIAEGFPGDTYNYTCNFGFESEPDTLTVVCELNNETTASWSLGPPTCTGM